MQRLLHFLWQRSKSSSVLLQAVDGEGVEPKALIKPHGCFISVGHAELAFPDAVDVQTGKGHADLSAEYSSIPSDMKKVAAVFGKEVCADITEEEVIARVTEVKEKAGDRALLRALHFFEENKRVEKEVCALKEDRFEDFLELITESGNSSWKWLQNCYVPGSEEQGITTALALTELFLKEKGCGACRVHGGGFAGVIMAMIPNALADEYIAYIEKAMGQGSAYRMSIRPYGAVCVNDFI